MNNKAFIAGLGKTNVDLLYADMKRIPSLGEEVYTDNFSLCLGGGLPATLLNLARLNVPVRLGTYLGEDMFSAFAESEYKKHGVQLRNFHRGKDIPVNITSAVIVGSDRAFISYGKPAVSFSEKDIESFYQMASGAAICYMESEALMDVYRQLKSEGTMLVYDMGWDDDLSFEKYAALLSLADLYVPNRKEAMKLTGAETPQEAALRLSEHFERVIVKADRDGCYGLENGSLFCVPEIKEFHCTDATGAGDAFLSGLLYGLYHSYSFKEAVLFGNLTGGKAVTAVGALSAYFNESELLTAFHKNQYLIQD